MKKTKVFITNSIIVLISSLFIKIITSSFDIYLANIAGSEAIGTYSIIMSVYMFAVTLATSGINLAITKVVSEESEKNSNLNYKIINIGVKYSLFFSILSLILLTMFSNYICSNVLMNKVKTYVLYVLGLSLPFLSLSSCLQGYFIATRKVGKTSRIQIYAQLIKIYIVWLLAVYIFPNNINNICLSLVIGTTLSEIISFLILYISYKVKEKRLIYSNNTDIKRRIFKISLPIAITSYIRSGLHTLKHILIPQRLKLSGISYSKAISNYGIICGMAFPIIMFPSVIVYSYSSLLIPEFSRYSITEDKGKIVKDIQNLFKITLYFSIFVTGIFMFYGTTLGNLLYNEYEVGYYIKLLAPLVILMYLDNVVDNILKGLGKQVSVMCCNIVDLIVSVSFIYFLLPIFSTNGYIIVLYISEILNYTISVITLFKTVDMKFKYFSWFIYPVLCIIISIAITNILNIQFTNTTITLVINIIVCLIIYISFLSLKKLHLKRM